MQLGGKFGIDWILRIDEIQLANKQENVFRCSFPDEISFFLQEQKQFDSVVSKFSQFANLITEFLSYVPAFQPTSRLISFYRVYG